MSTSPVSIILGVMLTLYVRWDFSNAHGPATTIAPKPAGKTSTGSKTGDDGTAIIWHAYEYAKRYESTNGCAICGYARSSQHEARQPTSTSTAAATAGSTWFRATASSPTTACAAATTAGKLFVI